MSNGKILLVDDEVDLLDILSEFLEDEDFEVTTAVNGIKALEMLNEESGFDLLLSDINMPEMKGFELISKVKESFSTIKTALITAYDVNSYIELAKKHNIGNIIAKTSPFNFDNFLTTVSSLVSGDIFGLEKYFNSNQKKEIIKITHSNQIEDSILEIQKHLKKHPKGERIITSLRELLINAIYYGAKDEDGAHKEEWTLDVKLLPDEYIYLEILEDEEKIGISIVDQKGRLKKSDILYWLERNISRDPETGLIKSLDDEHGRGLFISREFIDSLIININPREKTEIILLNYYNEKFKGFKPLTINEL